MQYRLVSSDGLLIVEVIYKLQFHVLCRAYKYICWKYHSALPAYGVSVFVPVACHTCCKRRPAACLHSMII